MLTNKKNYCPLTLGVAFALLTAFAVTDTGWSQLQPDAPWPALGKDYQGTRRATTGTRTNGSIRWTYNTRNTTFGSPVISADGTVYQATSGGLYAVRGTGGLRWHYPHLRAPNSTPVIGADGTIYVLSTPEDSTLFAVNSNGTLRWSTLLGGRNAQGNPMIGPDGKIYVTNGEVPGGGYLYCLDTDGTVIWRTFLDWEANGTPVFGTDGTIYVGGGNQVYAIRPADGVILWEYSTYYPVRSGGLFDSNRLFIPSTDGLMYSLNPATGSRNWFYVTSRSITSSPAMGGNNLYFTSQSGDVTALRRDNGNFVWRSAISARFSSPAVGADGTVHMVGGNGFQMYALNPNNGLTRWVYLFEVGSTSKASPAIAADGTAIISLNNGFIFAFSSVSGSFLGQFGGDWNGRHGDMYAEVDFYQSGRHVYSVGTMLDEQGNFQLKEVPVGRHDLVFRVAKFLNARLNDVDIEDMASGQINLIAGDLNADNVIDDLDLLEILFNFGSAIDALDLTGDGMVDDSDLMIVLFNYGLQGD
ncbi:MAG: PQQ-binding-like beta-propeller repeat protein [Fimbriimonadia bacterium]|nr:PQQ-binding-like beta-propeller repeat protein [Fimbriimonadia bacterium]